MKFALLGTLVGSVSGNDARLLSLARAAVEAGHELAWIGDVPVSGELAALVRTFAPNAPLNQPWESLLDVGYVDGVLIGPAARLATDAETESAAALREEQLRKFVQSAVPVLVAHPASRSLLFCYELDMIRRETQAVLEYYVPGLRHPLLASLPGKIGLDPRCGPSEFDLGPIEQVLFERRLYSRDKDAVLDQLAGDVRLITKVCGEMNRVGTLGLANDPAAYGTLAVQFSGPAGIPVRWSVGPATGAQAAAMTIRGSRGQWVLQMPASPSAWKLNFVESTGERHVGEPAPPEWDDPAEAIAQFAAAIERPSGASDWFAAAQAVELADAAERSLKKGRAIELHYEEYSNQSTFKGRMSAIGCALLMVALTSICLVGFIEYVWSTLFGWDPAALPWPLNKIHRIWPMLVVAPLLLFLLIQVLPKLFPERDEGQP